MHPALLKKDLTNKTYIVTGKLWGRISTTKQLIKQGACIYNVGENPQQ